jgi:hypothetical protein
MFEKELSYIKDESVKKIAEEGVALLPDYFYRVPASSTGKYHPNYALGDGGLYRHVQAAVSIAIELFRIYTFTPIEQDIIVAALILHDGFKQGEDGSGNTTHEHPLIAVKVLKEKIDTKESPEKEEYLNIICDCISKHMGQWVSSIYSSVVLPLPVTEMEKYVHLIDYLASRKSLEFNFSLRE